MILFAAGVITGAAAEFILAALLFASHDNDVSRGHPL